MTSLVSDFIINPVLRQARRFSSPFGPRQPIETLQVLPYTPPSEPDEAEFGWEEDAATLHSPSSVDSRQSPRWSGGPEGPRPLLSLRSDREILLLDVPTLAAGDNSMAMNPVAPILSETHSISTDELFIAPPEQPEDVLPDPDGHRALRRRIYSIQRQPITAEEKAQLMQNLLTEGYRKAHDGSHPSPHEHEHEIDLLLRPLTPSSPSTVYEQPAGNVALDNLRFWSAHKKPTAISVSVEDAYPTFVPAHLLAPPDSSNDDDVDGSESQAGEQIVEKVLGCEHYRRNVKLQCSTCEKWYTCRLCHDAVETHALPRRETKHMLCMICGTAQAASDTCNHCGHLAAHYYCDICHLWNDDVDKPIYHCDDCGICRVGRGLGKDFFHCKICRACIAVSIEKTHKCIERATQSDCPICSDYMFSSPQTVVFMSCGHCIHRVCYQEHLQTSYKCPICSKSIVNMESIFRSLDRSIRDQPMPQEYANTKAIILCNDCSAKTVADYHFLGQKCQLCHSYNTVQIERTGMPDEDDTAAADASRRPSMPSRQISPTSASAFQASTMWPERGQSLNDLTHMIPAATVPAADTMGFVWGNGVEAPPLVDEPTGMEAVEVNMGIAEEVRDVNVQVENGARL